MATLKLKKSPAGSADAQRPSHRAPLRSTGLRHRPTLAEAQAEREERARHENTDRRDGRRDDRRNDRFRDDNRPPRRDRPDGPRGPYARDSRDARDGRSDPRPPRRDDRRDGPPNRFEGQGEGRFQDRRDRPGYPDRAPHDSRPTYPRRDDRRDDRSDGPRDDRRHEPHGDTRRFDDRRPPRRDGDERPRHMDRPPQDRPFERRDDRRFDERRRPGPSFDRDERGPRPPARRDDGRPSFRDDRAAPFERRGDRPDRDRPSFRHDDDNRRPPRGDRSDRDDRDTRGDRPAQRPDRPAPRPRDYRDDSRPSFRQTDERAPRDAGGDERTERPRRLDPARPVQAETIARVNERAAERAAELAATRPRPVGVQGSGERLSKRLGDLGLASRREADDWIAAGWVRVDGKVAVLGQRVGADAQIDIDPAARTAQSQRMTVLLHKPIGYVSGQAEDDYEPASVLVKPENRWEADPSQHKFHPGHLRGLAPAGRLDIDSTGLLVLTQDGRVARTLIGDESLIEKEYLVRVEYQGPEESLPDSAIALMQHGLELDGVPLRPAKVSWQNEDQLRVVLREGRKRQIRRMCEAVGLKVLALKRVRIGRITLGALPPGQWRYLAPWEKF